MTEPAPILDLPAALSGTDLPTVGVWNRLEGRPRTADFERALRVEVRDPLWMLTRQWQLGEFEGTDGGSPVTATYSVAAARPSRFRSFGGGPEDLPGDRPVETLAERRAVPFAFGADRISFDLRLAIGRRWLKLLGTDLLVRTYRHLYVEHYPIRLPDPGSDTDSRLVAHPEVWAATQTVAGRRMDGYAFYQNLKAGKEPYDGMTGLGGILFIHFGKLRELAAKLVAWFEDLIDQPAGDAAWDPRRLEHRFAIAAATEGGGEKVLTAEEYPGGTLDWHAFSVDRKSTLGGTGPAPQVLNRTVFPAPVRFSGMPLPRWWAIEDGRTNFAAVRPDSTDLARLVFLEFALVYSNDWFQVPCDLPAGTIATIRGLAVTDVFGVQRWITAAGEGDDEDRGRWSMFTLDVAGTEHVPADTALFLPPSVPTVANGPALEEVALVRDENANLVWGVEQIVRLATGDSRRGSEVAAELLAHRQRFVPAPEDPADKPRAPITYQAMNTVPENWIPFLPVHTADGNREIQLQRGTMPSAIDGADVRPRTALLREGLDSGQWYFVNEEEIPQTGTRLTVAYNRTRWRDGRVVVWLSTRRGTGRGEATSGLAFDQLVDTPMDPP
ncbi:hypothetical protein DMA12_24620 [Amycolatopsis balhimycina DSM 5908]|uniref:Uncharacterized protein n=1 Tax=Amycolatopsis balhimycina DSM 5908 TaxID=1081091 RepID=A0A428WDN0_AMYBA|nr:hypothetical protein [Amycolatopsis balhimycina]RSM41194.1 hypothetical protein DMA12_24620 [Amycolatopsis balhimycina DSM 5908]